MVPPVVSTPEGISRARMGAAAALAQRIRSASNHRSHLARIPLEKLFGGRGDLLLDKEHASTSSPRADPFTLALDHPLRVSLPGHLPAVPDPRWKIPPTAW